MVSRVTFGRQLKLDTELKKYTDIYTVQSEAQKGIVYGISDGKFAILSGAGAIFCPFHETPVMAMRMTEKIREEILEVYEEVRELKHWGYLIS